MTSNASDLATLLGGGSLPTCGDKIVQGSEACDGTNLSGASCLGLGYQSGTLACTEGCHFDVSGCDASCEVCEACNTCGNGTSEAGEQ